MASQRENAQGEIVNFTPEEEAERTTQRAVGIKRRKIQSVRKAAIAKMGAEVAAINSIEMVDFLVALWPMLDTASAPAEMLLVKDIYQYSKQKVNWLRNTATPAEIRAYEPQDDTGWPE